MIGSKPVHYTTAESNSSQLFVGEFPNLSRMLLNIEVLAPLTSYGPASRPWQIYERRRHQNILTPLF